jgi:Ca-activated chloride channel family protein
MTDGEDHEGNIETIVAQAAAEGIVIYTVGFGDSEPVPIPVIGGDGQVVTYRADSSGDLIMSQLDEITLQMIADQTSGMYQRASANGAEVSNLIRLINAAETGTFDSRIETRQIERFGLFVLIAIIALSLEIMTPLSRGIRP